MGGTWSPTSPPADPGFYVNFEALATATVTGGQSGVVLLPLHDAVWGPVGETVELYSLAEYDRLYTNTDCDARKAVAGAFTGTGYAPGAQRVLVHRLGADVDGGDTSTKAAVTVSGLDFEAKHGGTGGDNLNVAIDVLNNVANVVVERDGTKVWEMEFDVDPNDAVSVSAFAASLAAAQNNWFTVDANSTFDGSSGSSDFAGGVDATDDGKSYFTESELLNNDYNVVSTSDSVFGDELASAAVDYNLEGKRFLVVIGGPAGETIDAACGAAKAIDNENVVRVGYTSLETENGTISTAEFAPQLAGIIAANGPFRSITATHISGMRVATKASKADLRKARNNGLVMLVEDQIAARLYQDMTTYSSDTIHKPRKEFGVIKAVMVHHQIETDLTRAAEGGWIGGANVNTANYRRAVLDGITGYLARVEGAAMILPGWEVDLDDLYDNTGDSIHIKYGIKTSRVVERILNTIVLY